MKPAVVLETREPALVPAGAPPARARDALGQRLLAIEVARGTFADVTVSDLPALLAPGDLLVVNDAGTLPGSLRALSPAGLGEVRLVAERPDGSWTAVLFGPGDWRTPTEKREPPPRLAPGQRIELAGRLGAEVVEVDPRSARLVALRFDAAGPTLWRALYAAGRPVQYAHAPEPVPLGAVQTPFAGRPWAAEVPSAARGLRHALLCELRGAGIELVALTAATGLSATGDPGLDALLPLPERRHIPASTARAVEAARARGSRVIAVGTSATRALESAAQDGALAGEGTSALVLGPGHARRVVDGIVTGIHEAGSSHRALMECFAPAALLRAAVEHAARSGYRAHEQGDACLLLP